MEDLLENEESTEEKQFKAQKVVEKLEKKLEIEESSFRKRLEFSEKPRKKTRKQSRVPSNLLTFRKSKKIEDPLEFIE